MKMKVIVVNGTNPSAEDIIAQVKKTGCKNLFFTGIGLTKARKLVFSMPPLSLKFATFRKLANANEDFLSRYDVVSTIGDFVKGKGKAVQKKDVEISPEESKDRAERFCSFLKNMGSDIGIYGYSFFKDTAKEYGATKTMRRGIHYYAYFGKLYVRF
jgi:hypothetical protein